MRMWIAKGAMYSHNCPVCRDIVLALDAPPYPLHQDGIYAAVHPSSMSLTFATTTDGVRVASAIRAPHKRAAKIKRGDVITHVNSIPVKSGCVVSAMFARATETGYTLWFRRLPRPSFFALARLS